MDTSSELVVFPADAFKAFAWDLLMKVLRDTTLSNDQKHEAIKPILDLESLAQWGYPNGTAPVVSAKPATP